MPSLVVALAVALQQGGSASPGQSSPVAGDTTGYWQQRVHYTISATLDEPAQKVRARGTLWYVNNSPDTLREMYFHQYLNAFRPGSKWSETDEREGRVRFQHLEDPDDGYERFTAPLQVGGVAVRVEYPGAPDSTVAHIRLPAPLAPRDSVLVSFEWDARPSTVPRRQGRRGRHWDLAQWYPKVAVYDRGGWQHNALRPAGEFYGEFGTYDVTLIVANEQVVGATGVPVSGDPGWSRAIRGGVVRSAQNAYDGVPDATAATLPGTKAVRFYARDVHHFAWTASPDYRYEGGVYARAVPRSRFSVWDTVSVHVLYRPGDDSTWGGQRAVRRTIAALQWLELLYGPYAYPQLTANHRIDGGGSETPMMMMNGSPSQGLILHEGGHMYAYGILANNEWRSAWMDEGLTSYQTAWAQLLTPLERVRAGIVDEPAPPRGYRARALQMPLPRFEIVSVDQTALDLLGRAEPIGKVAHEFRDFATYNDMVYDRAEVMFSQLRDMLGDTVFVAFLRDYHTRWALRHVDERAMRASAERVSGRDLGWFFDQWVRRTGVMDYALAGVRQSRDASGGWVTEATIRRRGEIRQPIAVGVRTSAGWTLGRATSDPFDRETVRITTREEPLEVRLDPYHSSWDWDRRNDVRRSRELHGVDWPFLQQAHRDRNLSLWRPMAWYSRPGGATIGLRQRSTYLGWLDQAEMGVVTALEGSSLDWGQRVQYWGRLENPTLPFLSRPAVGWRARVASLDDVLKVDIGRRRELGAAGRSRADEITLTSTSSSESDLRPELWQFGDAGWTLDLTVSSRWQRTRPTGSHWFSSSSVIAGTCGNCTYAKVEGAIGGVRMLSERARLSSRLYYGDVYGDEIPGQRALLLSAADPVSTFENHWWRPRGGILKRPNVNFLPLGGPALRGYDWTVSTRRIAASNLELSRDVVRTTALTFGLSAFADGGYLFATKVAGNGWLVDAGVGVSARGRLFDQPIDVRLDFPVFVHDPVLAIDRGHAGRGQLAPRWVVSFNDIW